MKKMIAACLVLLCMTGLLAACDKQEAPTPDSGRQRPPAVSEPDSREEPDTWEDPDSGAEEEIYQPGSWEGNVYTNEYLGLKAEVDEGWQISSAEEITEMNRQALEEMNYTDAQIEQALKKQIYDTMFVNTETGSNIQITVEDLYPSDFITEETYLKITKDGLKNNSAYECKTGENKTMEIGGREFVGFDVEMGGLATQRICIQKNGRYMICLLFTDMSATEEGLNELTAVFSPL